MHVPDYSLVSRYARKNSIHGGTLILLHVSLSNKLSFVNVDKFDDLLVEKEFEFSLILCADIKMYILCIYRPPSSNAVTFLENLELLLAQLPQKSSVVLAGDLNINFSDNDSVNTQRLANLLTSFNLAMHVNSPTRISQFSATTIDYLCTNLSTQNVSCSVVAASLSDHEAVHCLLHINLKVPTPIQKYGRIYSKSNYSRFYQFCQKINWEHVVKSSDPFKFFHESLINAHNCAFPLRKIKIKNSKPWITRGIKNSGKNLRSLHLIRKYTNNILFHEYFGKYRTIYRKVLGAAKEGYYKARLNLAANKSKESWAIINELRGKTSQATPQCKVDPNTANDYYCTIGSKLTEKIGTQNDPLSYLRDTGVPTSFYLFPTDIVELKEIISDIKNKKSSGVDNLPARMFENIPDCTLNILIHLINQSFESGIFPCCLKTSIVIPLYKGGSPDEISNFRPISLLCTLSKIIEKLVKKRMLVFLNIHKILNNCQFGFQPNKNTGDAMFMLLEEIYYKINEGEAAAAVFCDLSKAFDCVNHKILLQKLHCYGFRGTSLAWFQSYLTGRYQIVESSGQQSSVAGMTCGVPQGSVLGPVLFLLYINDLASISISGSFTLFADDTTILWHNKNPKILHDVITSDISLVKKWCDSNLLTFNLAKTNVVTFGCHLEQLHLGSHILANSRHSKFLGLYIDPKLNFQEHVRILNNKLASGCYAIRTISAELGYTTARTAYFSLVESHLRYGIPFWGSCGLGTITSVLTLQKRAIRYMCKARVRDSCKPLFVTHKVLTVIAIFIHETVCLFHKKRNKFDFANNRRNTRQASNICLPLPSSSLIKKSLIYNGKKVYNHLPITLKNIYSGNQFRNAVKKFLIDKPYYNLQEYYDDSF